MNEPKIENGFAAVEAGSWLMGRGQPSAVFGKFSVASLKGFVVPDRRELSVLKNEGEAYLSSGENPFLTHLVSAGNLGVILGGDDNHNLGIIVISDLIQSIQY